MMLCALEAFRNLEATDSFFVSRCLGGIFIFYHNIVQPVQPVHAYNTVTNKCHSALSKWEGFLRSPPE